ncbi:hypothetical protein GCM10011368_06840 [Hyunsoonleella pacifica]|nr:hypothetical protein GCM10011368_06840 [Hyunsoonleella pacifica]
MYAQDTVDGPAFGDPSLVIGGTTLYELRSDLEFRRWSVTYDGSGTTSLPDPQDPFNLYITWTQLGTGTINVTYVIPPNLVNEHTTSVPFEIGDTLYAGTIGNPQTICENETPSTLTNTASAYGGDGTYSYQWQSSDDGISNWTDITGATSTTYTPPSNLTTTRWYRRGVTSNGVTQYTFEINVTVNPIPGLPTGNDVTLSAPGSANLTATPYTGADSINWYTTASGGTAVHTGTSYTTPTLNSTTTYYVASLISVSSCESTDRHPITVSVDTTNSCTVPQSEIDALEAFYNSTNGLNWTNPTPWNFEEGDVCNWFGITVENNHVVGIQAPYIDGTWDIGLSGTLPKELENLPYLKYLEIPDNELSGPIPPELGNLTNLKRIDFGMNRGNLYGPIPSEWGNLDLEKLVFGTNAFIFSDFENEHVTYSQKPGILYSYSPQAKVDEEETIYVLENGSFSISTELSSESNNYQWFFSNDNGITFNPIGENSRVFNGGAASAANTGIYYFTATNSIVTGLTLERHKVTVVLDELDTCGLPKNVRTILSEFYDATNGDQWINNTNWKDPNVPVCDWYGISTDINPNTGITRISGLNLSNNNLEGYIPQTFANLDVNTRASIDLSNNKLRGESQQISVPVIPAYLGGSLVNNEFVFGDLENLEFTSYPRADFIPDIFHVPQAKVDEEETIRLLENSIEEIPLTSNRLYSPNNTYKWYKNGIEIPGATSLEYVISNPSISDQGIYYFIAENPNLTSLTLERNPVNLIVYASGEENTFCTSEIEVITTANLIPSGSNILWYTSETETEPIASDYDFVEDTVLGGVVYWYEDTNNPEAGRTAETIYIDENTPLGETYQEFSVGATVALLQANGANINWYSSANGGTPLDSSTQLIDGEIYYAEDDGLSSCRLAVEVFVGTTPPEGDGVQYLCPNSSIDDIVLEPIPTGHQIVWYLEETGGTPIPDPSNIAVTEGTAYFAAQIDANSIESVERKSVTIFLYNLSPPIIPLPIQKFYNDEYPTIADLKVIGSNVEWYSQETDGTMYNNTTSLVDGQTYYAQHIDLGCVSPRIGVTVKILEEAKPTIVACEKFKPQLGGHYIISGWVREQEASVSATETRNFSEVSTVFVDLLNHLKDKFLSEAPLDFNIPAVYTPVSSSDVVNFDALVPYIIGQPQGAPRLVVYNFSRIEDDYGRAVGFEFSLTNADDGRIFTYYTPTVQFTSCNTCFNPVTTNINLPLLGRGKNILNFTNAQFINGTLTVSQTFIPEETVTVPNPNPDISVSPEPIFSESITYYDYEEAENAELDISNYENAAIELTYIDESTEPMSLTHQFFPSGAIIDGWQRIVGEFTIPVNAKVLNIELKSRTSESVNIYFDDIRVQPFESNMKTFVYHPVNQRLMSELDENNYATFYEYDLEGGLVRVKKETEKGIYTIQETRSGNIKATN